MILADKITEERKKNGWSQEELAEKLGVSRQSVSKWESAGSVPDLQKVIQLAELFGVGMLFISNFKLRKPSNKLLLLICVIVAAALVFIYINQGGSQPGVYHGM